MQTSKRISKGFWIWGDFPTKDNKYLYYLQRKVQSKLNSPEFSIHLTLAGPYKDIDTKFENQLRLLCLNTCPIKIELNNYQYKEDRFQSFFIKVKKNNELINLRKKIFNLKEFHIKDKFFPHISLSYGIHSVEHKIDLIHSLPEININLIINKLLIVKVDENINKWEILKKFRIKKIS